jgi:uncharacterized protein (UPF0212 family)
MEDLVLDSVGFIGGVDFSIVLKIFLYIYLFFWLMVVIWVWFDATERSSNLLFKIFGVVVTLLFNIFGLLIYLLIRPTASYEERYLNELEKKYLKLETSGLIKCPECTFELEPGFVVCPRCGKSVKVKCENCHEYIDSHWEFCAYCGVQREIPEGLQYRNWEEIEPSLSKKQIYARAFRNCLYKVGAKQNECIVRVRELFKDSIKPKITRKKLKPKKRKSRNGSKRRR